MITDKKSYSFNHNTKINTNFKNAHILEYTLKLTLRFRLFSVSFLSINVNHSLKTKSFVLFFFETFVITFLVSV